MACLAGMPAGYAEIEMQDGGNVELASFGVLPQFAGRGVGGRLLTRAVERAWEMGGKRVWLHTCSLDSPAALPGYLARGFRLFKEEKNWRKFPDETPGPWPRAGSRPARLG
jgi:GNAT superfamily N-acetyltransferase